MNLSNKILITCLVSLMTPTISFAVGQIIRTESFKRTATVNGTPALCAIDEAISFDHVRYELQCASLCTLTPPCVMFNYWDSVGRCDVYQISTHQVRSNARMHFYKGCILFTNQLIKSSHVCIDSIHTFIYRVAQKSGTPSGLMLTQEGPTFLRHPVILNIFKSACFSWALYINNYCSTIIYSLLQGFRCNSIFMYTSVP